MEKWDAFEKDEFRALMERQIFAASEVVSVSDTLQFTTILYPSDSAFKGTCAVKC